PLAENQEQTPSATPVLDAFLAELRTRSQEQEGLYEQYFVAPERKMEALREGTARAELERLVKDVNAAFPALNKTLEEALKGISQERKENLEHFSDWSQSPSFKEESSPKKLKETILRWIKRRLAPIFNHQREFNEEVVRSLKDLERMQTEAKLVEFSLLLLWTLNETVNRLRRLEDGLGDWNLIFSRNVFTLHDDVRKEMRQESGRALEILSRVKGELHHLLGRRALERDKERNQLSKALEHFERAISTMDKGLAEERRRTGQRLQRLETSLFQKLEEAKKTATPEETKQKTGTTPEQTAATAPPPTPPAPAPRAEADESLQLLITNIQQKAEQFARERVEEIQKELARVKREVRSLSKSVSTPPPRPPAPALSDSSAAKARESFDFFGFEEQCRGPEQKVRDHQRQFVQYFSGASGPVLDIGCGRGEFLELMREAGIETYGIDSDPRMVAHVRQKGLSVEGEDLFQHLGRLVPLALGGIFASQVIEHLTTEELTRFLRLARERLRPGGAIVLETPNPCCLAAYSGAIYADPTHVKPVHPEAIKFLLLQTGFENIRIEFNDPMAEEHRLQLVPTGDGGQQASPELLQLLNANFQKLNGILFNYANFAAIARRPQQ
ncbi:MAG: class I SAM-dependent methyltransferase, partial [bacterium]